MSPPGMSDNDGDENGMPPPEVAIPQIADLLLNMADQLPPDIQKIVTDAANQLQAAFASKPPESGEMGANDAEAYGEPSAGI
jgi:hypothetical protein